MCTCGCCAKRYLVSMLGLFGFLMSIGLRSVFSLVATHIARPYNQTNPADANDEFFIGSCPVYGSSLDWHVDWSQQTVYLMHTTYFIGYTITQVPGGALAARFSPKWVCGIMIMSTCLLFILLPIFARIHYGFVFAIRGLQGLAEGGSVPAYVAVISAWAPKTQRSSLFTIAYAGAYISPAVAFLSTGLATCFLSWDSIFYIYGGLGLVWFVLWGSLVYQTPDDCPNLSEEEALLFRHQGARVKSGGRAVAEAIPWRDILTSFPVLAVFVGAFCRNWIFSMQTTQQPQYFKDSFPLNTADIGLLSAIPPVLMTIVVVIGGMLFDKLVNGGYINRTLGRKLAETVGFGSEAICILCLYFVDTWRPSLTLLCIGIGLSGFAISGYQVNPLDLSPQYAGVVTGLGRIGFIGSILSSIVASSFANHTLAVWKNLWLAAGIIHLVGVVLYDLLASGNVQPWDPSQKKLSQNREAASVIKKSQEYDPLVTEPVKPTTDDRETWEKSLEQSLVLG